MNATTFVFSVIFVSTVVCGCTIFAIWNIHKHNKTVKRILCDNLWDGFISMVDGFKYVPHDYDTFDAYIYYDEFSNARYEAVIWKTGTKKGMTSIFDANDTNNIILSTFNMNKSKEMARLLMVNR